MPLTPLVSARSGRRSAYFGGPFTRIEDTADVYGPGQGLGVPFCGTDSSPQQDPYPLIRWGTHPNFSTGDRFYSFQWLKNTTEFGLYYPDMNSFGSGGGSLSGDLANLTLAYEQGGLDVSHDYYKTLAVDDTVYALGPNALPLSGPVVRPVSGTFLDHAQTGFYYSFVNGLAEVFSLNVTPYWENARYLILTDGTKLNAFSIPDELTPPDAASNGSAFYLDNHGTINNGVYNYTVQKSFNGVNSIPTYLTKWQSSAYNVNGPFTSEAFSISLSDSADDLLWQDYFASGGVNGKQLNIIHNTNKWIFIAYAADTIIPGPINARPAATVFIFSMDMTTYERVDVTFSSDLNWASYFMDVDGLEYGLGSDPSDLVIIYEVGATEPSGTGGEPLRAYTITVDDHDFYLLNLGQTKTAVVDLSTEQWSMWNSPGLDFFRLSDALPWDFETVGGDFEHGILWTVDATVRDDDDISGDPGLRVPIQSIIRGFYPQRLRDTLGCFRAVITCAQGSPVATGVGIRLRTSDNMGLSFKDHGLKVLDVPGKTYDIAWASLGLIAAPGRIFEIIDTGYAARIEALDIDLGSQEGAAQANG